MAIANTARRVSVTEGHFNLPVTAGIDEDGHWYYYLPKNVGNTLYGAAIKPYRWGSSLPLTSANLTIEGTFPLITESWEGSNQSYHGGTIEWIGQGINNATSVSELNAFFFNHLGSLSPATDDDAFYWDRAYTTDNNYWYYYQYHKHLPTNYVTYENGRMTFGGNGYIYPEDKSFASMISTRVRVSSTDYTSVLVRIHTPSVGGAHNSHNDVNLPVVATKNYMPGGILRGNSNRYHAFYISSNGSGDWTVYNRTFTKASGTFTVEVNLGDFNLADPSFNPAGNSQSQYPIRASCGTVYGNRIYFPVIFNDGAGGFDLKIWSFNSLDTIAGGSLLEYTISSGVSVRPDCYLTIVGNTLYAAYTDVTNGGVRVKTFDGTNWTDKGQVVTNSNSKYVRIHGFRYSSEDINFYLLLSGTSLGGGTYLGPGLYSFEDTGIFPGYEHFDYDANTNSFIVRGKLQPGYLKYTQSDGTLTRYNTTEPQGIATGTNILDYKISSSLFYNKKEVAFGGEEYYYRGIFLEDGRKLVTGRIYNGPNSKGFSDLLVSLLTVDNKNGYHFAWGGDGDDYITGTYKQPNSDLVWITGYTKSELVQKRDIKIQGFCRNTKDDPNALQWNELKTDSNGNFYLTGSNDVYGQISKYNYNFELSWEKILSNTNYDITFSSLFVDSNNNTYSVGQIKDNNNYKRDSLLSKFDANGNLIFAKAFVSNDDNEASHITYTTKNSSNYLIISINEGKNTSIIVSNTNGSIIEQKKIENLTVNKIRDDSNGRFLFAGHTKTFSGNNYIITNQGNNNYVFNGGGLVNITDPTLNFYRGEKYRINVSAPGHPFWIKTVKSTGTANSYTKGVLNNGIDSGYIEFVVPDDAPNILYYSCQLHSGMSGDINIYDNPKTSKFGLGEIDSPNNMIKWISSYSTNSSAQDIQKINSNSYIVSGIDSHVNSLSLMVSTTESSGVYTASKVWAKSLSNSYFHSSVTNQNNEITFVGYTTSSNIVSMGQDDSLIVRMDTNGDFKWQNVFGHDMKERFSSVVNDVTNENIVSAGWSQSHTSNRDAVFFRSSGSGFGTGVYYREGNSGVPYYYVKSDISSFINSGTLTNLSVPDNITSNITLNESIVFDSQDASTTQTKYDGAYGKNGVYSLFIGNIDLSKIQDYLNTEEYKNNKKNDIKLNYTSSIFNFWQVHAAGDGSTDDGNIFGYDIIYSSDGKVYVIGQTSGDVAKTNTGLAGVYDYILVKFDPITEQMSIYQNGSDRDEETYALTEMSNGKLAFVGRTTGNLGATNLGGYDIFLGIFDPVNTTFSHYSTGSGLDDKGVNVHDLGNNKLAIVYSSYGAVGNNTINSGSEDIGYIEFNYSTNQWANSYQTGSTISEIFDQNGKPSVLLRDGRLVITTSTSGIFADDSLTYGALDVGLAIIDTKNSEWKKYQIGTGSEEFVTFITADGDKLLIGGHTEATWEDVGNGMFVEFDSQLSFGAKKQFQ